MKRSALVSPTFSSKRIKASPKESLAKTFKTARYAKAKSAFARNVRKVLEQEAEKKQIQYYEANKFLVAYNATAVTWQSTIFPVTPYGASLTINQGVGDGYRVGNRIKIHKLRLKGLMCPTPYSVGNNPAPEPCMVRMWLMYDKENPNIIPSPTADFIQFGNTSQPLQGTMQDMVSKVNTDRWVVKYEKLFKVGFATYGGTGTTAAFQSFTNNDFKLVNEFDIDLTDMVPKTYVFDDNTSIPETRGLFMVFEAVPVNGIAPATNIIPVEMSFSLDLQYTDV